MSLPRTDVILRTRWYVRIRWLILSAIAVPSILSLVATEGFSSQVQRDSILAILAIGSNGLFYVLAKLRRGERYFRILAMILLAVDILLVTFLIFQKGGVESRSTILYVIPILMTAAIFGRKPVYATACITVVAYDTLLVLDYMGIVQSVGAINPTLQQNYGFVLNSIFFFSAIFLIIGALADFIIGLLLEKEREAYATAEALKRAQSVAKLGSWEWDIANNHIYWSDELYKIFGLKRRNERISYQQYLKYIHPHDRASVQATIQGALKAGKPFSFNHRVMQPNRSVRQVHGEGQVLFDETGKPVKMLGTAQDVTAQKALEKAKHEFVSLASHQLRTPATGVKAFLALLTDGYAGSLTEEQQRYLEKAYDANERQLHIIDDLLNIANIESGKMKLNKVPVDLAKYIEAVVGEYIPAIRALDQSISLIKPDKPLAVEIDQNRFRMVIDNLISNASKYTDSGGLISVTVRRYKGKAAVVVQDTGIGIAKKDMIELFQKFYRIEKSNRISVEGNGLGLYVARHIVKLHGGDITVHSKLGKGSTFIVTVDISKQSIADSDSYTTRRILPAKKYHIRNSANKK